MKNYLKILNRIIAPNVSKQDSQIGTNSKSLGLMRTALEGMMSKLPRALHNSGNANKRGYVYILLDVSGSMHSHGILDFAKEGVYAFAKDAVKRLKYKVGVIAFDKKHLVLVEPTRDLGLITSNLNEKPPPWIATYMDTAFVYACTALYDICPTSIGKRVIVAATDWGIERKDYYDKFKAHEIFFEIDKFYHKDEPIDCIYSSQSFAGLLDNSNSFLNFIDTTEFISISLPGAQEPPPLFSKYNIKANTNEDVTQAIASAAKLLH